MKFSIGDKVTFKNEKLTGFITDILKSGKIRVEVDGFDMDVDEKELIKIDEQVKKLDAFFKKEEPVIPTETVISEQFASAGQVVLITVPALENQVLSGAVILMLENKTFFDLPFSFFFKRQSEFEGIVTGVLKAGKQFEIGQYHRGDLKQYSGVHLELLFFKSGLFALHKPVVKDLAILLPELQIANAKLKGRNVFARIQTVFDNNEVIIDYSKLKDAFTVKPEIIKPKDDIFSFASTAEIDLHIEALEPAFDKLNNSQILDIQIKKFHLEMDKAIVKKMHSIIFIHGIGDGVLKNRILNALRDYNGVKSKTAHIGKYGLGAIEVIF